MRLILVDWARKGRAGKRGGGARQVPMEDFAAVSSATAPEELIALDDALTELGAVDPRKTKIIEMRYFGGMKIDEVAQSPAFSRFR